MNKIINIKIKSQFSNFLILGGLLIISGVILLIQSFYIGIALVLLGFLILTFKRGIKLDPNKNMIKYYREILFVESGNWKKLNTIHYVALVKVNLTQQMYAVTISGTYTDTQVKLNLIFTDKKILALITDKKNKILPIAEKIATGFNIDIYDNSEGKKNWIKFN